jgi:hypothetical protein
MSWSTFSPDNWAAMTPDAWASFAVNDALGSAYSRRRLALTMFLQVGSTGPLPFPLVSNADHITGATGVTPTVTISQGGGAFAAAAGTVSEIGNGWYKLTPTSADTSALGPLMLHATGTGCDPIDLLYEVVAFNPGVVDLGVFAGLLSNYSTAGSAGAALANINNQVGLFGLIPTNILPTQYTVTPQQSVAATIVRGDDYLNEVGAILFSSSAWIDLTATGIVVVLTARTADATDAQILRVTGSVSSASAGGIVTQTVTFQPTHTQTKTLPIGTANFDVRATLADGSIKTLILGTLDVLENYYLDASGN